MALKEIQICTIFFVALLPVLTWSREGHASTRVLVSNWKRLQWRNVLVVAPSMAGSSSMVSSSLLITRASKQGLGVALAEAGKDFTHY